MINSCKFSSILMKSHCFLLHVLKFVSPRDAAGSARRSRRARRSASDSCGPSKGSKTWHRLRDAVCQKTPTSQTSPKTLWSHKTLWKLHSDLSKKLGLSVLCCGKASSSFAEECEQKAWGFSVLGATAEWICNGSTSWFNMLQEWHTNHNLGCQVLRCLVFNYITQTYLVHVHVHNCNSYGNGVSKFTSDQAAAAEPEPISCSHALCSCWSSLLGTRSRSQSTTNMIS